MKTVMIIIDIIALAIFISLIGMMYVGYWRDKNKLRTPYDREQERLMKTTTPEEWEDTEKGLRNWKQYIFDKRNELTEN